MRKNLLGHLIYWYLVETPREILRAWANLLYFNLEYFSLFFLLRTLFAPWRRTKWDYGKKFDVARWLEAWSGNIISRILGGIIRTGLIAAGLLAEAALLVLGPVALAAWFILPLLLVSTLQQGVFVAEFPGFKAFVLLALSLSGFFWLARSFMRSREAFLPLPQTKTLTAFIEKEEKRLRFVFNRLLLNRNELVSQLKQLPASGDFSRILAEAHSPEDVLRIAAQDDQDFAKTLVRMGTDPKSVEEVALWFSSLKERVAEQRKWWTRRNLKRRGTLGRDWTSGFSPLLDRFSFNLTKEAQSLNFPEMIGHEKEIKAVERILARDQTNNVLLVGEPGSGKKTIVRELAKRSLLGETLDKLNYKRVMELDIPALLSQTESPGEREAALDEIFQEVVRTGNVILVIDEFHNFVNSSRDRPGRIDITGVLAKYLSSPEFPVVACTTFTGLHRDIEQSPSLLSLLEKVEAQELSEQEALLVLQSVVPSVEARYKKFISYPALKDIISLSAKYIQALPLPRKALDILDEAMVHLSQINEQVLLPKHIAFIISEKTEIPIGEMESEEMEVLLNLEDLIHKRIINQNEAVKEVSSALRRARTQVGGRKGPMGSFLFLGPTGVGKTETAKALAAIYFGSESRMIRLDMSEFQEIKDINRLLGFPGQEGLLTTSVRENPFSLILLDELEKAHPNVLNLFLQVLDEGHVTDGLGRKVDFTHSIIIATSNAGYQIILRAVKKQEDFPSIKQEIFDHLFAEGIFRPEFVNRFDAAVLFTPLTQQNLVDIAALMLKKTQRSLAEKGIELRITEGLKARVAELGYNPQFGARDMRRVIQDKVENALATALLRGLAKRGDTIEIDQNTFEVRQVSL
ncbi:MAG: ATP-dependent Clp protease ATP-binding subunit [bacterium]|nr:ATP-dependent Clp protease ATP-binding subunit [bacterium]